MSIIAGERLTFRQSDGSQVTLIVNGDERYAHYQKEDGYTVVYDAARGRFCYADVVNGRFVSTGVSALAGSPPGVRRGLRESEAARRDKLERSPFGRRHVGAFAAAAAADSSLPSFTFGPSAGLLSGRRLSRGSVRGLTILVEFQDVSSSVTRDDVHELLNGTNYTRNGNACSAREYFARVSTNKLDYRNVVVGPYRLSQPQNFYIETLLIREALDLAIADGLDLRQFDSLNQGILDALNVLYAGRTQYVGNLWPHNHTLRLQRGTIRTDLYLLTSMGSSAADLSIGTFCHENGHLLCRFPDMYDYGERDGDNVKSEGIGAYCLMGSGNHNNFGRTPSPVCAYLRELAGWCDNVVEVDRPGEFQSRQGDYNTVIKHRTNRPNEYFIIENRSRAGLDEHLPANGLAVYHCDILGSNELQEGTASKHYQCALLQADGRRDLENNLNNGDGADLFGAIAGVALAFQTNPSTRMWDGADSGLEISAIGAPGDIIRFTIGRPEDPDPAASIRGQASPGSTIPDNNAAGISSRIAIGASGTAARLSVAVDISHTWIGDLVVELISPSGRVAVLHNRTGENQHNLLATFASGDVAALGAMVGEAIKGEWTLRVRDAAGADTGSLNKWSIELAVDAPAGPLRVEASPNLAIPDNTSAGVSHSVAFTNTGTARRVRAVVEIAHTWINDLRIELVSPGGRAAVLHGRTGGSQKNLNATFDSEGPAAPLAGMVGQPIAGNWTLRIADLEARDTGTLKKWSLEIVPG
ncbi:MAG: M6 family metalloprotease domain-containing protein [Phycisphaerales bacterium]|nr:M6 family metalloprotease domain-containing protein [Phycisphaerales bacterium]